MRSKLRGVPRHFAAAVVLVLIIYTDDPGLAVRALSYLPPWTVSVAEESFRGGDDVLDQSCWSSARLRQQVGGNGAYFVA